MPANNGKVWNWNVTNTLLVISFLAVAGIIAWLAARTQTNTTDISDVYARAKVNSAVIDILAKDLPTMKTQLSSVDRRLYRLESHFGTLPKGDKMGDVLIKWKIRSAMMTDFGAMPRAPGDQDTMEARMARDLAKCGVVEILGKPKDVVDSASEVLEDEDET